MPTNDNNPLRHLPQIEQVLSHPSMTCIAAAFTHEQLTGVARAAVDTARTRIREGVCTNPDIDDIALDAANRALLFLKPSLRRVVNASGVIIHTNLGRSVLAKSAQQAVADCVSGYSTLEYDTQTQQRGSRHAHCERLICALTGAEAAIAVNNNAAAVMMVLTEFAAEHEAVVSRGELVEIGGSFRIPDIMALSHARMVEVGTTNKTHVSDYERALTKDTAMLLKVHPSNYRLIGFTEAVDIHGLRRLADQHNAAGGNTETLVYEDQGSGAFAHLDCFGTYAEPTVAESLKAGADLVSFSGDKLLGGPQAGIIVGKRELIQRLKDHPLARALRLDKMTLAALEATLRIYLEPEVALTEIPTLRMLCEPVEETRKRAQALMDALEKALPKRCAELALTDEIARAGGGALPMCDIPTVCVQVTFLVGDAQKCERFLAAENNTPIVVRLKHEQILLDARTLVDDDEMDIMVAGFRTYFEKLDS